MVVSKEYNWMVFCVACLLTDIFKKSLIRALQSKYEHNICLLEVGRHKMNVLIHFIENKKGQKRTSHG